MVTISSLGQNTAQTTNVNFTGGVTTKGQLSTTARGGSAECNGAGTVDVFQSAVAETVNLKFCNVTYTQVNAPNAGILIEWTASDNTVKQTLFDTTNATNTGVAVNNYVISLPVEHIQMASQDKIRVTTVNAGTVAMVSVGGCIDA